MIKSILLVSTLVSVLIAPFGLSQELTAPEPTAPEPSAQKSSSQVSSVKKTSLETPSNSCPTTFYDLTLPDASKQCRIFGVKKPSTMSLFVVAAPKDVAKSLSQQLSNATHNRIGGMYTFVSNNPEYRVYVFKDGHGTQVNIRAE